MQAPVRCICTIQNRFVRKNDAFARAGRPGGEPNESRSDSGVFFRFPVLGGSRREKERAVEPSNEARGYGLSTGNTTSSVDKDVMHIHLLYQRRAFVEHESGRDRHNGSVKGKHGERKNDIVDAVWAKKRHTIQRLKTLFTQLLGDARNGVSQGAEANLTRPFDKSHLLRQGVRLLKNGADNVRSRRHLLSLSIDILAFPVKTVTDGVSFV